MKDDHPIHLVSTDGILFDPNFLNLNTDDITEMCDMVNLRPRKSNENTSETFERTLAYMTSNVRYQLQLIIPS